MPFSYQLFLIVDPCASVTCSVSGETCSGGECKCGTSASCAGQTTGAYCDANSNTCKCTSTTLRGDDALDAQVYFITIFHDDDDVDFVCTPIFHFPTDYHYLRRWRAVEH